MRTGDLGFMAGDELVFTGRRKDLIIVEGRNHYPQDLEKTAEGSHPAVRQGCTAAFSVEGDGEERVVVMAELDVNVVSGLSPVSEERGVGIVLSDIIKAIRRSIAEEHGVGVSDVVLVRQGAVHKTSSGKIQRSGCRKSYLSAQLEIVSGQSEIAV